jgi:hypothetical protein
MPFDVVTSLIVDCKLMAEDVDVVSNNLGGHGLFSLPTLFNGLLIQSCTRIYYSSILHRLFYLFIHVKQN